MRLPSAAMRSTALHLLVFLAFSCTNDGNEPPPGRLHFPVALGISEDGNYLFVANSNFNLRYNSGSLHSYDLNELDTRMRFCAGRSAADREECGAIPEQDQRDDLPELIVAQSGLLVDEVLIGSYADGLAVTDDRLYLPVRSDANLTFVDINGSGGLDCGGTAGSDGRETCDESFRRGIDEAATLRGIELPADPVAIHVGPMSQLLDTDPEGTYVLTAHRSGRVSLFLDEASGGGVAGASDRPRLVHTLTGLPEELIDLTVDPASRRAWITNAGSPVVSRTGVVIDDADHERSFLFDAGALPLRDIDTGRGDFGDTRVVRFDPRPEVRRAYVLSRLPRALLTVDLDASGDHVDVDRRVPVGFGPSRLEVVNFPLHDRTLAFVSCFDSGDLYVIDVDASQLVGIVRNLGGPFELAVQAGQAPGDRERIYVLDFSASAIRVIDPRPMFECLDNELFQHVDDIVDRLYMDAECSPTLMGVLGRPQAVRELI